MEGLVDLDTDASDSSSEELESGRRSAETATSSAGSAASRPSAWQVGAPPPRNVGPPLGPKPPRNGGGCRVPRKPVNAEYRIHIPRVFAAAEPAMERIQKEYECPAYGTRQWQLGATRTKLVAAGIDSPWSGNRGMLTCATP